MKKIKKKDYSDIIRIYNSEGKTASYDFIRSQYGLKNPYCVITRLKASSEYEYDAETDKFGGSDLKTAEGVFMNLEDLCTPISKQQIPTAPVIRDPRPAAMEKLVHELIGDRLLELSRFITIDSLTRTIMIDHTSLAAEGYKVVSH